MANEKRALKSGAGQLFILRIKIFHALRYCYTWEEGRGGTSQKGRRHLFLAHWILWSKSKGRSVTHTLHSMSVQMDVCESNFFTLPHQEKLHFPMGKEHSDTCWSSDKNSFTIGWVSCDNAYKRGTSSEVELPSTLFIFMGRFDKSTSATIHLNYVSFPYMSHL